MIGKNMQVPQGTSVEAGNKRVAGHIPRETLVRKLDQPRYSRDKTCAVTGHSNIKSLDLYLDAMNEKKSSELSLTESGVSRAVLQAENTSTTASDGTGRHLLIKDNRVQHAMCQHLLLYR